jgi:hypothetical protein
MTTDTQTQTQTPAAVRTVSIAVADTEFTTTVDVGGMDNKVDIAQQASIELLAEFSNSFKRDIDETYSMSELQLSNFKSSTTNQLTDYFASDEQELMIAHRVTCARGLSHIANIKFTKYT